MRFTKEERISKIEREIQELKLMTPPKKNEAIELYYDWVFDYERSYYSKDALFKPDWIERDRLKKHQKRINERIEDLSYAFSFKFGRHKWEDQIKKQINVEYYGKDFLYYYVHFGLKSSGVFISNTWCMDDIIEYLVAISFIINSDGGLNDYEVNAMLERFDEGQVYRHNEQIDDLKKEIERIKSEPKTYIMKDKSNGFYKIGRSKNPRYREKTLQSEKPTIQLVKTWDYDIENTLHEEYKRQRLRGEWFNLTKLQVKYICKHY